MAIKAPRFPEGGKTFTMKLKLGIFYEQDENGKDTGRVQVAETGKDAFVLETFDTEEAAQKYIKKEQAEADRNERIKVEYLAWESATRKTHKITRNDLRHYLVNYVCV